MTWSFILTCFLFQEQRRVEKIQEIYVDALQSYVMANRKKEPMVMFSKLMSVLTELRSLGYNNSRQCIELRMERNKKLPEFLEEIWDLKWLMALPPPLSQATAGVTDDEDASSNHSAGDPTFWEKGPHHSPKPPLNTTP